MADQDLQGLVQRLRSRAEFEAPGPALNIENTDCVPDVSWPEMAEIVTLMSDAADALERLSKRGTCDSCRFSKRAINPMTGSAVVSCVNVRVPRGVRGSLLAAEAAHWGCIFHEPQPTATEEASK